MIQYESVLDFRTIENLFELLTELAGADELRRSLFQGTNHLPEFLLQLVNHEHFSFVLPFVYAIIGFFRNQRKPISAIIAIHRAMSFSLYKSWT
jgi:hypothetical protein